MTEAELRLEGNELCSECISKSNEQFGINDLDTGIGGIPIDGTTLTVEDYYESEIPDE